MKFFTFNCEDSSCNHRILKQVQGLKVSYSQDCRTYIAVYSGKLLQG